MNVNINWNKFDSNLYKDLVNTDIPDFNPGTLAYDDFWDEQDRRCLEGYQPRKFMPAITGRHYYYLNMCQINLLKPGAKRKSMDYPFYRELDRRLYDELDQAIDSGEYGLLVGKPRRVGLSYFGASACTYELSFFLNNKIGVAAGQDDKAQDFYEKVKGLFEDVRPEYRAAISTKNDKEYRLSYFDLENRQKIECGLKSTMYMKTMYANPSGFEGKELSLVIFEEAGLFDDIIAAYKATEPCFKEGAIQYGIPLIYGCVCAGTKVWNNKGDLVNIEDLSQEEGIVGYKNGSFNKEPIIWIQPPAEKECVRITTNSGTVLECSTDHPLMYSTKTTKKSKRINGKKTAWKITKWKEAGDIEIGDQLSMIDKVDIWSDKKIWEPRLVGLLIGDGSYGFDKTPVLSSCDEEIFEHIAELNTITEKECPTKDGRIYKEIRIKEICPELRELEIYGQTKNKKRLPKDIHNYCKEDVCELLGGFFDADGYVSKQQINLTSSCLELLNETKLLLQKLGIHSSINLIKCSKVSSPKSKNDYYRLHVVETISIKRFYKQIKFIVQYKQDSLKRLYNSQKGKINKRSEHIPGIKFERVVSVEKIGVKPIYNLNAGDSHTYIANGIITHNTGGDIEKGSKGYQTMWKNPQNYNLKKLFISATDYFPGDGVPDEKTGKRVSFFDFRTGKTNAKASHAHIVKERQEKEGSEGFIKHIQTYPLKESDIFIKNTGGYLNRKKLNAQKNNLDNCPYPILTGKLEWETKDPETLKLISRAKNLKEVDKIHLQRRSKVVFVEDNEFGTVKKIMDPVDHKHLPFNPDIGGCDSYDDEVAEGTGSLGATIIYRCFHSPTKPYDMPIAYIKDRGTSNDDDEFYSQTFRLCVYYDIEMLLEWTKILIKNYFEGVGGLRYLMQRPDLEGQGYNSRAVNQYGFKMSNQHAFNLIVRLLKSEVNNNFNKIWFEEILDDLIDFGEENSDLGSALGMVMIAKLDMFGDLTDGIEEDGNNVSIIDGYGQWVNENGTKVFKSLQEINSDNRQDPYSFDKRASIWDPEIDLLGEERQNFEQNQLSVKDKLMKERQDIIDKYGGDAFSFVLEQHNQRIKNK